MKHTPACSEATPRPAERLRHHAPAISPDRGGRPRRRRALAGCLVAAGWLAAFGSPALAQSDRPLTTEPATTLAWGDIELELGVESFRIPNPTGTRTRLWNAPTLAAVAGIGPAADLRIEGAVLTWINPESGASAREPGDFTIWTKVRFWRGTPFQPVVGGRLGVKIPITSNESGLGTDETDFFAQVILTQQVSRARLNLNLGLAILGDPQRVAAQSDAITYGLGCVVPVGGRLRIVGEVAGRQAPGSVFDRSFARLGARWQAAGVLWDAALTAGFIDQSEDWGALAGVTLPFRWKPKEGIPIS